MKTLGTDITKAFPYEESYNHGGMDLRDYFAAKALQGMLAHPDCGTNDKALVTAAYGLADMLMEARK